MGSLSVWLLVEVVAAVLLLIGLVRLTNPERLKAGQGRGAAQVVSEVGLSVALASVLSLIRVYRMPQGGSVSLEMVPVFYVALRSGAGTGTLAGIVLGLVKLLLEPYIIHPLQFLLDYPLAFGALGIAGLFRKHPLVGVFIGSLGRFLCHLVSGVVFFSSYAPAGTNVWVYSATYNASFMIPELLIALVVMVVLGAHGTRRAPARG